MQTKTSKSYISKWSSLSSCQATFVVFNEIGVLYTVGSSDWVVQLNTYVVHVVPARIMLYRLGSCNFEWFVLSSLIYAKFSPTVLHDLIYVSWL